MKKDAFDNVIEDTPLYMPRFELIKPETWMGDVNKGDFYLYHSGGSMIAEKQHRWNLAPLASKFKFVKYVRVRANMYEGFDVIEE